MKRDFTQKIKNELKNLIDEKYDDSWQTPQIEFPGDLLNAQIETDWEMLTKKNQELSIKNFMTSQQIDKIWSEVLQIDTTFKNRFVALNEAIKAYGECLRVIKEKICPTAILNTLKGSSQVLLSDLGNVTKKFYTQMVEYEYEKLILRDENQNIIDYDWENIEKFMVMDTKKISVYQLDAFVKMFDELDCTIEKQREIMEKFLEKAYIKSEHVTEGGLYSSIIPVNCYKLSEAFAIVMKRYCERKNEFLEDYQILNRNIFSFLVNYGSYFMVSIREKFQVELLNGICINNNLNANGPYDFTIEFPNAKITEDLNAIAWTEVDEAKGYLFYEGNIEWIDYLLDELSIAEIQGLKRDKKQETFKMLIDTIYGSIVGAGMTTGQSLIFTSGTTIQNTILLNAEIDAFNEKLGKTERKIEIGNILNALGAEDINIQVFENQIHINTELERKVVFEKLNKYYQDTSELSNQEINIRINNMLENWSKNGEEALHNDELKKYVEWFYNNKRE